MPAQECPAGGRSSGRRWVGVGRASGAGSPPAPERVPPWLGTRSFRPTPACLGGEVYAIAPQPHPAAQEAPRPPPPPPSPASSTPLGGIHVAHTVRNALSEGGAGGVEWRDPEPPKKGYGLEPPSTQPWEGRTRHQLSRGGGRWEVRASGLKCLTPARPRPAEPPRPPPTPLPHNLATSSRLQSPTPHCYAPLRAREM